MTRACRVVLPLILVVAWCLPALCAAPSGTAFYRTKDSDDWVVQNVNLQTRYLRAILVGDPVEFPKSVFVHPPDFDLRPENAARNEYPVSKVFRTLQEAADEARGGDLVVVTPGTYAGFEIGDKPDAADRRYIHFRTLGEPGQVVIDRPAEGKDGNWMIYLKGAHHVIIDGFNIAGATGPGLAPVGARAGIMIDGDFANTGRMAHHIIIANNYSHNHSSWGLHATDSHTVLVQNNVFALSCGEHSAYVSDGSDNYCIRANVFFGSSASGLQCNLDPEASVGELLKHPDLRDYPEGDPSPEWARGLINLAEGKFGANNFPDGRGINFIVEGNVVNGNGKLGGGSFNFAALQDSVIQNNLIYGNFTTGIAQWDNANPYDAGFADPGPSSAKDFPGPRVLPFWGCRGNLIRNNTVVMNNAGRVAMLLNNGSWGNKLRNNVFLNDLSYSMEVTNTSTYRFDSGYNVLNSISIPTALIPLASCLDENNHSVFSITTDKIADEFVKFGDQPWILTEGAWWKLNPDRPDFRPLKNSKLLRGKGDPQETPLYDLTSQRRIGADIGACGAASQER